MIMELTKKRRGRPAWILDIIINQILFFIAVSIQFVIFIKKANMAAKPFFA